MHTRHRVELFWCYYFSACIGLQKFYKFLPNIFLYTVYMLYYSRNTPRSIFLKTVFLWSFLAVSSMCYSIGNFKKYIAVQYLHGLHRYSVP